MTHEDFADLVSPQIRNAPIVRELDTVRQQELRGSLILAVPLVAVLLFSVWQHFELLQHGYRIEQMRQEYARQQELNRHLRLEIETLRAPARIERVATEQLNMVAPGSDQELVIDRAAGAAAPDSSVVATRQGGIG
jgi:cell division protein FtsL